MKKDNATTVLARFVASMNIPVTRQSVGDELLKHPDNGSLLAFSDVLNNWRVPNAAYQLRFEQLTDVPLPFIAFLSNKEFGLLTSLDEKQAIISNERWNNKKLNIEEFKKLYSGSVLVAEKEEASGEADFGKKRRKEIANDLRMPVFFTGAFILLLIFILQHTAYLNTFTWQIGLLTFFKTAGLITSVLLLIQSIDTNNPLIQKLCGGDNNKNCNAILSSKAAKVTDELSWSEVGFFYFAGTWLTLLFNSGNTGLMQVLAFLSVLSLPYTVYSIYYQWQVAKQWCLFCCAVQGLLWLEFFAFLPYLLHGVQTPALADWTALVTCMAVPVLIWILIKPYLLQAKQIAPLKQQLQRFKYNSELFQKLLNDEVKYNLPQEEDTLIIGNREAENIITMVSNPYCQPCAKAHKALDEWLANRDDIKLQILFSTQNHEKDKKTEIAAHLMALQQGRDDLSLKKALNDWYGQKQKNYTAWAKEHPAEKNPTTQQVLERQKEWCTMAEIQSTPTLFINGRRLPKNYQPEDLKYFI